MINVIIIILADIADRHQTEINNTVANFTSFMTSNATYLVKGTITRKNHYKLILDFFKTLIELNLTNNTIFFCG